MSASGQYSELSGSASDVVQARDVQGGIHFHGARSSFESAPRQLPGDVSGFVNRAEELRQLGEMLARMPVEPMVVGLYVITGTAGVGKTSLALHWAHSIRHRFPDGQLYVNLRGYDPEPPVSAGQALDRFLRALGVPPSAIPAEAEDKAALYRSILSGRRILVVLDNAATVKQVRLLLPGSSECLVLVTSRSRLSGLIARDGGYRFSLDVLSESDAIRLLHTVTDGYRRRDDEEEIRELARLCARLPLALRIAAERAASRPLMLLRDLIADLRDESVLWDALTPDHDDDADAVRTVFAWSYRALPVTAARVFRLLGLHPGPDFGVPAVAALAEVTRNEARQLLDILTGAHMLEQQIADRYQFHDLLRAYATEQVMNQETNDSRRHASARLLSWYLRSLRNAVSVIAPHDRLPAAPETDSGSEPLNFPDAAAAFAWYETEYTNIVGSARVAAAYELHDSAWRFPVLLRSIFVSQNPFEDWIAVTDVGLASARRIGDRFGEAELQDSLGKAYVQSHRLEAAEQCHRAALAIRQEISDDFGVAASINSLGLVHWRSRRLAAATADFEESLEMFRALAEPRWQAVVSTNLGMAHVDRADIESANEILTRCVEQCRAIGDTAYEGNALFFLAMAQREAGLPNEALASIESALAIARDRRLDAWGGYWLMELGRVQRALGLPEEALTSYQRSAVVHRRLVDRNREAMAIDGTGECYREIGRYEDSIHFHRLSVAIFRETGDRWWLATALYNLAMSLGLAGRSRQAIPFSRESWGLFGEFEDRRAVDMRNRAAALVESAADDEEPD
ncbi:ATP-binding protein [Nocardia sp. alder85J]|uniref:ATP-binding protein n=1 Tax=Nocardia sp. alder85J TaxID=2862949 RepID=UPI001CD576DE|nr:tetratricopeptide repeat protein [Nocardia sp. alder85J]MCX4098120.1 tetratricopeptide repeat protein [Nocardia sp. alder85J]